MKTNFKQEVAMPSANLTINKSRVKIYNKTGDLPTYYLKKGQEFQIELFNPTADIILAKIKLNNKAISQGGLVLKPGERVFLERYLDVAKKFLFDTYEVSGGAEAQKAIEQNGDFSVEFYKERQVVPNWNTNITLNNGTGNSWNGPNIRTFTTNANDVKFGTTNIGATLYNSSTEVTLDNAFLTSTMDLGFMDMELSRGISPSPQKKSLKKKSKSIETGRIEQGSYSNQEIKTVNYDFEYFPFHTLEYKILPESRKINTSSDIKTRKYCTNCGKKQNPTNKFCANCGSKQ